MIMLRLARTGSKKRPVYHLVAADRRSRRDGRFVENLGYFIPGRDILVLQTERVEYWLSQGAQPTITAKNLIKKVRKLGNTEIQKKKEAYVPPPIKPVEPKASEAKATEADAAAPAEDKPAEAATEAVAEPKAEAASE